MTVMEEGKEIEIQNTVWQRLKLWAKKLKREVLIVSLALGHPQTPWYAKVFAALIVGYALSPIDFIPDFIPVLGYLDDVILLPLGIALAIKLIPPVVLNDCREKVKSNPPVMKSKIWLSAYIIIGLWIVISYTTYQMIVNHNP
jgi:uncharacterized membrane protein YkvA (DUF1232 family)